MPGSNYRRVLAVLGSALFLVLAPGTVVGVIPWWISKWQVRAGLPGSLFVQLLGFLVLLAGILVLLDSFARFALQGIGTPAPVLPTRHLVVTGLYRYVRNPMYVGVVSAVLGQSMILQNLVLLGYAGLVWFISHLFVVTYEEPALHRTFGKEYQFYCANVPRWIPRLRAWTGS